MRITYICPKCGLKVEKSLRVGEKLVCPRCNVEMQIAGKSIARSIDILRDRKNVAIVSIVILVIVLSTFFVILPAARGDLYFLIVLSGSMEPNIHTGDIVVSSKIDPKLVKNNDVITFCYKGSNSFITHRVVDIINYKGSLYFRTKGDANEDPDTRLVNSDELVGRVAFDLPYLGYLPAFAKTPLGCIVLIIIPGSLLIVNELANIKRELIKKRLSR